MSVDILGTNCDQCVCMVQCCFTSTETVRLIRTGSPGQPPRLSHSSWTLKTKKIRMGRYSNADDTGTWVNGWWKKKERKRRTTHGWGDSYGNAFRTQALVSVVEEYIYIKANKIWIGRSICKRIYNTGTGMGELNEEAKKLTRREKVSSGYGDGKDWNNITQPRYRWADVQTGLPCRQSNCWARKREKQN